MFAIVAGTGTRCGEAFGLRVEDLKLSILKICLRRGVYRGQEITVETRKGKRVIDIDPALGEMLGKHLKGRPAGRALELWLGTPICKSNVGRKLKVILKQLNHGPAGSPSFRHGRVSGLQTNGVPEDLVKQGVGHSNRRATSIYTHPRRLQSRNCVQSGLLAQEHSAEELPDGPNAAKFAPFAASA